MLVVWEARPPRPQPRPSGQTPCRRWPSSSGSWSRTAPFTTATTGSAPSSCRPAGHSSHRGVVGSPGRALDRLRRPRFLVLLPRVADGLESFQVAGLPSGWWNLASSFGRRREQVLPAPNRVLPRSLAGVGQPVPADGGVRRYDHVRGAEQVALTNQAARWRRSSRAGRRRHAQGPTPSRRPDRSRRTCRTGPSVHAVAGRPWPPAGAKRSEREDTGGVRAGGGAVSGVVRAARPGPRGGLAAPGPPGEPPRPRCGKGARSSTTDGGHRHRRQNRTGS